VVELKFRNQTPTRYPQRVATGRCNGVHKREHSLHPEYLARLRSIDRNVHQTPAGTVGPLETGFSIITNATDFKGWVVGLYGEQSTALAGFHGQHDCKRADRQVASQVRERPNWH
jgi:hypothetical protein